MTDKPEEDTPLLRAIAGVQVGVRQGGLDASQEQSDT